MRVKNRVGPLQIDQGAVLSAVLRSDAYRKRVEKYARDRQAEIQAIGQSYYESVLQGANELFQEGVTTPTAPRRRITARAPHGHNRYVAVAWKALSEFWLDEKARRARAKYKGKHRSVGPDRFWLDQGKLRTAFAAWFPGKAQATANAWPVRIGKGQYLVTFTLDFKKLPIRFLDSALRRALMLGADAGRRAFGLEDMAGMPRGKRLRGVYRAAWTEAYRPLMRPLAMRLGKAMHDELLKSLRRR